MHKTIVTICAAAALIALFSMPGGYYILLRILFFGSLVWVGFSFYEKHQNIDGVIIIIGALAILYNPLFMVYLHSKVLWAIANFSTVIFMFWVVDEFTSSLSSEYFAIASEEYDGGSINKGLWAKIYSETEGDESKTLARYLKTRATEIQQEAFEEQRRLDEEQRQIEEERRRVEAANAEAERVRIENARALECNNIMNNIVLAESSCHVEDKELSRKIINYCLVTSLVVFMATTLSFWSWDFVFESVWAGFFAAFLLSAFLGFLFGSVLGCLILRLKDEDAKLRELIDYIEKERAYLNEHHKDLCEPSELLVNAPKNSVGGILNAAVLTTVIIVSGVVIPILYTVLTS